MPKSGLSGSVRGRPAMGRPYRDTPSKALLEKDDVQADPDCNFSGKADRAG